MVLGAILGLSGATATGAAVMADRYLKEAPPAAATAAERRTRLEQMATAWHDEEFPGVTEVTAEELHARRAQPSRRLVVVDVRGPGEVGVSMLAGEGVVTAEDFEADYDKWKGHEVIAMCTAGYRSAQYAQRLAAEAGQRGLGPVHNLRGGILAHTHAGLPLVDPATGEPTNRVHVFAPRWALHGDGYIPVSHQQPLFEMVGASLRKVFKRRQA